MSYESPITVYQTQQEMVQCIRETQDEMVFAKIRQVVDVNKEELIKALQYDRDQYKKGYEDGLKDAVPVVHGHWYEDRWTRYDGYVVCSACKKRNNEHKFCPECGAKMDEDGEQDGNDEFKTAWDVIDWLEERCQIIKDEDILERYRQVYFDLISEIANRFRAHQNRDGEQDDKRV